MSAVLLPLLLLAAASPAHAQSRHARECAAAVRASFDGRVTVDAIEWLWTCRDSGAVALAAVWDRRAAATPEARRILTFRSRDIRDARVYAAVARAARDVSRPPAERIDALIVLASYVDSSRVVDSAFLAAAEPWPIPPHVWHPASTPAWAAPLPASRLQDIPRLLRELASGDPDPSVRAGALTLRRAFSILHPRHVPLDSGALRLTPACGARVTVRSLADVPIVFDLEVATSGFRRQFALLPEGQLVVTPPAGEVVATRGGMVVARLVDRRASCPPRQTP